MSEPQELSIALFAAINALACAEAQLQTAVHTREHNVVGVLVYAMRVAHATCEAALTRVEPFYDADTRVPEEYAACTTTVASALMKARIVTAALEYASTLLPLQPSPEIWCGEKAMRAAIDAENTGAVALGIVLLSECNAVAPPRGLFVYALKQAKSDAQILHVLHILLSSPALAATIADRDESDNTALMIASERGNARIVQELLACPTVASSADAGNNDRKTALMSAAKFGCAELVHALLACPAVVSSAVYTKKCGYTALMVACVHGNTAAVNALLTCPAVCAAANDFNNIEDTALMIASRNGHMETVLALLACPVVYAAANRENNWGETAYSSAVSYKHAAIAEKLVRMCPMVAAALETRTRHMCSIQ